ncbi:MAG: hypothetical protein EHM19_12475 [Candidatus Latescibacterota bacterium]|nr:MAG: hypothetical protein EHM19_12475 [Candidatus Latescibacterota bacterium]
MRRGAVGAGPALGAAVLLLASALAAGAAEIALDSANPIEGRPGAVRIDGAEGRVELEVTYRPGSRTETTEKAGAFGGDGVLTWTPAHAGITRLAAVDSAGAEIASRNVAVRFRSPPLLGVLICLSAGALLFGGAALAMRWALEEEVAVERRLRERRRRGAPST